MEKGKKKEKEGIEKIIQLFELHTVFEEYLNSVPNIHMLDHNHIKLWFEGI